MTYNALGKGAWQREYWKKEINFSNWYCIIIMIVCESIRDIVSRQTLVENDELWKLLVASLLNTCQVSGITLVILTPIASNSCKNNTKVLTSQF